MLMFLNFLVVDSSGLLLNFDHHNNFYILVAESGKTQFCCHSYRLIVIILMREGRMQKESIMDINTAGITLFFHRKADGSL